MFNTSIDRLRLVGKIEGVSFIVLVFLAMPLKYMYGQPMAVRVVGMAHGWLFLWFCWQLWLTMSAERWTIRQALVPFVASLVPFGPFVIDRRLEGMKTSARTEE